MPSIWYVGVGLEIVSTMSGTVGKQLIRMSALLKQRKNLALSRLCLIGGLVVNTALGPIIDMAAYSFAAQSLIAPFGGLDVVWNAMLAPYMLNEKLTPGRVVGCLLIVVGTTFAGAFGNHSEAEYTIEYIEELLLNMRVAIYGGVFLAWFLLNYFWLMRFPEGSAIRGVSLGCTAGTIAGNMFCVKAAIELIQRSIHEQEGEIWLHWLPYVLLLGAVFFAVSNVKFMTQGLQEYEALFMVTIYEGSMIVSGCISGSIVLLDLRGLEPWRIGLYALGVGIICCGMYWIFKIEAASKSSLLAHKASIDEPAQQHIRERSISNLSSDVVKDSVLHAMPSPQKRCIHAAVPPSPSAAQRAYPSEDGSSVIGRPHHDGDAHQQARPKLGFFEEEDAISLDGAGPAPIVLDFGPAPAEGCCGAERQAAEDSRTSRSTKAATNDGSTPSTGTASDTGVAPRPEQVNDDEESNRHEVDSEIGGIQPCCFFSGVSAMTVGILGPAVLRPQRRLRAP